MREAMPGGPSTGRHVAPHSLGPCLGLLTPLQLSVSGLGCGQGLGYSGACCLAVLCVKWRRLATSGVFL